MPAWTVTFGNGATFRFPAGSLEGRLNLLRHDFGCDEFTVCAFSEDAGVYVPERTPDTIPAEWA